MLQGRFGSCRQTTAGAGVDLDDLYGRGAAEHVKRFGCALHAILVVDPGDPRAVRSYELDDDIDASLLDDESRPLQRDPELVGVRSRSRISRSMDAPRFRSTAGASGEA